MSLDNLPGWMPAASLAGLMAVLWLLEAAQGRPVLATFTGRKPRNLAILAIGFAIAVLGGGLIAAGAQVAEAHGWGLNAWRGSPVLVLAVGVLAIDLVEYWRHRLCHEIGPLWRLHRLHHTDLDVDVTTSLRNHPFEQLMRIGLHAAAALALGIPAPVFVVFSVLQMPVQVLQHARIVLPGWMERSLRLLVVTPGWHLVHHSTDIRQTDTRYVTMFTVWDHVFRTAGNDRPPERLGIDGYEARREQTLAGMLANPFR